jgi:hypothetical protein
MSKGFRGQSFSVLEQMAAALYWMTSSLQVWKSLV